MGSLYTIQRLLNLDMSLGMGRIVTRSLIMSFTEDSLRIGEWEIILSPDPYLRNETLEYLHKSGVTGYEYYRTLFCKELHNGVPKKVS